MGFAKFEPAYRCAGGARPGAKALAAVLLEKFPRGRNGGIYNCRRVRGRPSTSIHSDGRAIDIMVPNRDYGAAIVKALLPYVGRLGIQTIINNRTIWSAKSPRGRRYTGVSPHYDHVHIELNRAAGKGLTKASARAILKGAKNPVAPKPAVKPAALTLAVRNVQPGDKGAQVLSLQKALAREVGLNYSSAPGVFGPKTRAAYKAWQIKYCRAHRIAVTASNCDGAPGLASLAALGAKYGFKVIS
jgi:hypothetical protein